MYNFSNSTSNLVIILSNATIMAKPLIIFVGSKWSHWTEWGGHCCSGYMVRGRKCLHNHPSLPCYGNRIDKKLVECSEASCGDWSPFGDCNHDIQTRIRPCSDKNGACYTEMDSKLCQGIFLFCFYLNRLL